MCPASGVSKLNADIQVIKQLIGDTFVSRTSLIVTCWQIIFIKPWKHCWWSRSVFAYSLCLCGCYGIAPEVTKRGADPEYSVFPLRSRLFSDIFLMLLSVNGMFLVLSHQAALSQKSSDGDVLRVSVGTGGAFCRGGEGVLSTSTSKSCLLSSDWFSYLPASHSPSSVINSSFTVQETGADQAVWWWGLSPAWTSLGISSLGADTGWVRQWVRSRGGGLDTRGGFDLGSAVPSRACSAALVPSEGAEAACTSPFCARPGCGHMCLYRCGSGSSKRRQFAKVTRLRANGFINAGVDVTPCPLCGGRNHSHLQGRWVYSEV